MTTYLGKSCSFGLPRVPFVNCRQFMYLVISLLVLKAGCGIWLHQFLIIAYYFTFLATGVVDRISSLPSVDAIVFMTFLFVPKDRNFRKNRDFSLSFFWFQIIIGTLKDIASTESSKFPSPQRAPRSNSPEKRFLFEAVLPNPEFLPVSISNLVSKYGSWPHNDCFSSSTGFPYPILQFRINEFWLSESFFQ